MSDNANDTGLDPFADDSGAGGAGTTENQEAGAGEATANRGNVANDKADDTQADEKTGDDKTTATPAAGQQDPEEVIDAKTGQKMIPEHRFKAALKEVTDKLDAATGELSTYKKPTVPDKEVDPEGHALHVRMEASTNVMREMRPDYQEVINHYAKMAESNPLLNQAVAENPLPAKLAYDIAKKDMEIKEALELKGSEKYKKFLEWEKSQETAAAATTQTDLNETVTRGLKAVPNLNRSTNASPKGNVNRGSDDELFKGAL